MEFRASQIYLQTWKGRFRSRAPPDIQFKKASVIWFPCQGRPVANILPICCHTCIVNVQSIIKWLIHSASWWHNEQIPGPSMPLRCSEFHVRMRPANNSQVNMTVLWGICQCHTSLNHNGIKSGKFDITVVEYANAAVIVPDLIFLFQYSLSLHWFKQIPVFRIK